MTGMRIILMATTLATVAPQGLAQPPQPVPETFLIGASDVPLMPGLTEDEAASVFFDKPAGRILIASPGGCVNPREARRYYGATLPQLGWLPAPLAGPDLVYLREGERLTLEFSEDGDCAAMRFLLSPVAGAE